MGDLYSSVADVKADDPPRSMERLENLTRRVLRTTPKDLPALEGEREA